jgi:hypothetical protein
VQNAPIEYKLDFLEHLKMLGFEAQYSINEWNSFSQHLQKMAPKIYQKEFEGMSQQPLQ